MYNSPVPARIIDSKYQRFASELAKMGLKKREFQVVGETDGNVIVDQHDLGLPSTDKPFTLRRDIVEFIQEG